MREDEKGDKAQSGDGDQDFIPTLSGDDSVTEPGSGSMEHVDEQIGPYRLLKVLGEGGYGIVYLAEQQKPIKRQVALKVIKPGMDSKQVIARFEAERQTLALLDHPNIAHVFDAGTTETDQPYFAMEYVKGVSITKHCDEQKLSIEERLELFLQVCEAVHYAHQKGIIHRDIKPSNIMVSIEADKALPKIIDFGVAKALTQPLTERTLFTEQGQLIGTPEYMSPEQAEMANENIDTRSDIYSLGILLYTLLTGALPFDRRSLQNAAFAEILRIIREEDPPHPSTRLSSMGEEAKEIAENRRTEIATLAKRLHKELEWIPLKAMRKERSHRYQSASQFADDIRNYLSGTPLIAGPESAAYRLKKFTRKHRTVVGAMVGIVMALSVGLAVSTTMFFRSERDRIRAENAEMIAEQETKRAKEEAEARRQALYFNRIALAETRLQNNDVRGVREQLALCPADLRAWEWYYLWCISDGASMTLRGHIDTVLSVAFSPDGKRMVSVSRDRRIKVWDVATWVELMILRPLGSGLNSLLPTVGGRKVQDHQVSSIINRNGERIGTWVGRAGAEVAIIHENRITIEMWLSSAVFSPDGKRIASAALDRRINVWDVATGKELRTLLGHSGVVSAVDFSPDGKWIISSSWDKTIKVWAAETGDEVMTLSGHHAPVMGVAFSPDGKYIVSGSWDKTIKVWVTETGDELATLCGHDWPVMAVAFSPDGKRIVSGSWDKTIKVWDTATGEELKTLLGHTDSVWSVAFSPDGKHIVSGGKDRTIKVWDAASGAEVTTLSGHRGSVCSLAFSPDGKRIVSASADKTIKVWDIALSGEVVTLHGHDHGVSSIAVSPDATRIASSGRDRTVKVWDAITGGEIMTLSGHHKWVRSVAVSPDGKRIISGSEDRTIKVWDLANGEELQTLLGHSGAVTAVVFSPNSQWIISGSWDKTIRIWDTTTGAEVMTIRGHSRGVNSVAISKGGRIIVSGSDDKTIKLWDPATGDEIMTLHGHDDEVRSVAFSPGGKRIVSGGRDKTIKLWDVATGAELMTLYGHGDTVTSVTFSPDGRRIVSASKDKTIKVWDVMTGTEIMTLHGHGAIVSTVVFSPDARCILSGSYDKTIKVWNAAGEEEIEAENSSVLRFNR